MFKGKVFCLLSRICGWIQVQVDRESQVAVEDVKRLARLLGDHPQIGLPHVAADELQGLPRSLPNQAKKAQQRLLLPTQSNLLQCSSI